MKQSLRHASLRLPRRTRNRLESKRLTEFFPRRSQPTTSGHMSQTDPLWVRCPLAGGGIYGLCTASETAANIRLCLVEGYLRRVRERGGA
jgi:hypothetical protein